MNNGWNEVRLGDIAEFRNGLNFKSNSRGNGCRLVGIPDFGERLIPDYNSLGEINPVGVVKNDDYLRKGDLIFVRSNGNKDLVGRSLFINRNEKLVYSGFCIRARFTAEDLEPLFYAYYFKTSIFRRTIAGAAGGANIQNLNQGILGRTIVPFPSLLEQRRIASFLSAYDDLIENNLKRVKLLEESAQRTYEEWFVKFRVNGEALAINEETGLPEGWERKRLVDVADITYGYPFKANQFNSSGNGTPIIRIRNIPESKTSDFTTEIVSPKYWVEKGDLLVGMDGEFYINNWSGPKAYLVQRSCKISPKDKIYQGLLSQAVVAPVKFFEATISGATVAHLGKKHLETIDMLIPDKRFNPHLKKLNEWLQLKINLETQNESLRESLHILLPRLMNGTICLEQVEEIFALAAEPEGKYTKARYEK